VGGPIPWQKLVDPVDAVIGDVGQHLAEICLWIEAVEGRGVSDGVDGGGATATVLGADEEPVFSVMQTFA
jgi:hypothetical protein